MRVILHLIFELKKLVHIVACLNLVSYMQHLPTCAIPGFTLPGTDQRTIVLKAVLGISNYANVVSVRKQLDIFTKHCDQLKTPQDKGSSFLKPRSVSFG